MKSNFRTKLTICCPFFPSYSFVLGDGFGSEVNGSWNGMVGMVYRKVGNVYIIENLYIVSSCEINEEMV